LLNRLENLKADLILMKSALKNPRAPHSTDEQLDRIIKQVDNIIKEIKNGDKRKS